MAAATDSSLISPVTIPSPPEDAHEPIEIPRLPLESGDECNLTPTMSMTTEDDLDPDTLDLSGQEMSKLLRAAPECTLHTTTLILDNNNLQRLDNIHTYQCLEKLSVQNNRLIRMFQVSKLSHLKILNLSGNHISLMEGLKELKLLTWLSLSNNHIKGIDQLNQNVHLEHLDLAGNQISNISDMSYLKNIKVLLLHKNQISTLRGCEKFLPSGLTTLTLNDNQLTDLCDVSHLSHLHFLEQLTLANNPAIDQPEDERQQFDYRPYLINWCLSLRVLDGILVGAKESLKAEWMYSQSRGRQFTVGQHTELLEYLLQVCPLHPGEDWQEDKKLNLILSKVQEHQQSLRETASLPPSVVMSPRQGSNTLPRSHAESPLRFGLNRRDSGNNGFAAALPSTANSSASTTPTATPIALRRSSFGSTPVPAQSPFAPPPLSTRSNVRRSSRTSPSPVRRRTLTPTSTGSRYAPPPELGSYNLSLPRSLYGDDINGNNQGDMMTQSMDPAKLAARLDNGRDLMSASLDPSILMANIAEDYRLNQESVMTSKKVADAWSADARSGQEIGQQPSLSRPSSLFSGDSFSHPDGKDLYLQDLSDSELSQSLMYNRLQTRLNPVPESLNSPDIPPPSSGSLGRARDDPVRIYNRDLAISSSTVSTTSSSRSTEPTSSIIMTSKQQQQSQNGYNSSSSDGEQPRAPTLTTKTTTTTTTLGANKVMTSSKQKQMVATTSTVMSKIDTGLRNSPGKIRPSSASRSMSLGRKTTPANKQILDLKKQYNSNNTSPVAKPTSHVIIASSSSKEISRKRSNSHQHNEEDLATLLRHSADDEDEGDEEVVDVHHVDVGSHLVEGESSHSESSGIRIVDQRHQLRKSRSARRSTSISAGMSDRAISPAKTKQTGGRGESKLIRSQSGRMSVGPHKYAPEKYSDRESITPRSATLPTALRSSRRTSEVTSAHINNNNNNNKMSSRPNSASTNRPRSNTVNTLTTSSPRGNLNNKLVNNKGPQTSHAATTIQKNWRGHSTRTTDDRVQELKDEVKNLRTDQHIRHLTKELSAAKLALERERKLRALQMDAIKVLWKEVQLMDERNNKSDGANESNGSPALGGIQGRNGGLGRARPSGSNGSKISSRASEHSIAKLMETLEATAGTNLPMTKSKDTDYLPSSSITTPATPGNLMAQSMPPSLLQAQTGSNGTGNGEAVEALSKTCTTLQIQVEMLQTSLSGVMNFMSAFTSFDSQQQLLQQQQQQQQQQHQQQQQRTRHSSVASTTQDSFSYYPSGPMSLPLIMTMDHSGNCSTQSNMSASVGGGELYQQLQHKQQQHQQVMYDRSLSVHFQGTNCETGGVSMSRSCDCLTQTDISAVLTPKNELPPVAGLTFPFFHLKRVDIPLDSSGDSDAANSGSFTALQQQRRRDRSRSPRPQTLPGLVREGEQLDECAVTKIPGLAQLAGSALLNSPQAPQQVKAFARNLVEGLLSDTMAKQASSDIEIEDEKASNPNNAANEETDVSLSLAAEEDDISGDDANKSDIANNSDFANSSDLPNKNDFTSKIDVAHKSNMANKSGDLATIAKVDVKKLQVILANDEDNSSHVDTDSLEENSNSGDIKAKLQTENKN